MPPLPHIIVVNGCRAVSGRPLESRQKRRTRGVSTAGYIASDPCVRYRYVLETDDGKAVLHTVRNEAVWIVVGATLVVAPEQHKAIPLHKSVFIRAL